MITEEFVTLRIVDWLKNSGWRIISYDFPQSGTGFALRPDEISSKNKGVIIPDIVAEKDRVGLLFENKDRFYLADFNKVETLRTNRNYERSLNLLFEENRPKIMYYGIGFPQLEDQITKAKFHSDKTDFLVTVTTEGQTNIEYEKVKVFNG